MKKLTAKGFFKFLFLIIIFSMIAIFPIFSLSAYFIKLLTWMPPVFAQLAVSILWPLLVYILFFVLFRLLFRLMHKDRDHRNMFDDISDALDEIASGNYNVRIESDDRFRYNDLADKINKLARDLSSVEQMRQEFVSNVSHEIQSPLTSIRGFAVLLKKPDLSEEQRLHYAGIIETESSRLSHLSDNLLKLSMLDAEQQKPLFFPYELNSQIESVILSLEPQWTEKEIQFELDLAEVVITADEELLSQVWINLIHNSIKFTPVGGTVTVSLKKLDTQIVCRISDTGSGIPEENIPRVFERFYKVDKARDRSLGGNGLGLSLVKKIVDLHGGKITCQSTINSGTTFTVSLPT